ncbi:Sugar transporter [Popillia japonica]|uniref:Sugar transporter n=1 Tax=Popillia japonica TaxID=7064 RepID=A0AAW1LRD2_POPJA
MLTKENQDQLLTSGALKQPQYVAAISVCLGAVAAGTVLGWTSNINVDLELGKFNNITVNTEQQGWIFSYFRRVIQPETPIHLLRNGKDHMARISLQKFRGKHYDVEAEISQMKAYIEENQKYQVSTIATMKTRAAQKAFLICFSLMFFQQLAGINAVIFYKGDIFEASGIEMKVNMLLL